MSSRAVHIIDHSTPVEGCEYCDEKPVAACVLDEGNDTEATAKAANRDFDALENARQALHEAVETSHRRPTISDTEHIFMLAEEFYQWLQNKAAGE